MFFESTMTGQTTRYLVPTYLNTVIKLQILSLGMRYQHSAFLAISVFLVAGSTEQQRQLQEFMKACRTERRTLFVTRWNLSKVSTEVEMWGLNLVIARRGILFARTTIVGETVVLDRLERYLRSKSMV